MPSCKTCYWDYEGTCVSESLEEIHSDASFETCDCIGWLRKDFYKYFHDIYDETKELLRHRSCKELEEILVFINQQRK